jgi:hypothetical protein
MDEFATGLYDLFQRHQKSVNEVVESQIKEHSQEIRKGSIPPDSLLGIICHAQHTTDLRERYARRLGALLAGSLPAAFQTVPAKDEKHIQDIGQAVFQSAMESLQRETPQLPFSVVSTKPDFSKVIGQGGALFVEFKYCKSRERRNKIITEMTSRVEIYREQGAYVLFVVYDPTRAIPDDLAFAQPFEKHAGIWVTVVR